MLVRADTEPSFREQVESLVAMIPKGRVMTYGQIASLCGQARAARIVGGIAHFGDPKLPWQRVVNKSGGLASGYPGGRQGHKQVLEQEGLEVSNSYTVPIKRLIWWPGEQTKIISSLDKNYNSSNTSVNSYLDLPLIVVVGETASGKSALAMQLAEQFNGEIIAADSRTVYKGMDIGTAKPSIKDQTKVPHHLLDVTTLDKPINVSDFKSLTVKAITEISARGKLPIMVGGTGLYIDAVIFNFQFRSNSNPRLRKELSMLSVKELQQKLIKQGTALPENALNPRHLIRALESGGRPANNQPAMTNSLVIGLSVDRQELRKKIIDRVETMFQGGLEAEVRKLVNHYGWTTPLQTIDYQEFRPYLEEQQSLLDTKAKIVSNSLAYAKRQRTWFKRNNSIRWISQQIEAVDLVTTHLNKQYL